MIEPLRVVKELDCSAGHAFRVWTERFATWWPLGHTVSASARTRVVLEPRPGGRIYEVGPDGAEIEWGEVTTWDPPHRFGYLWHLRRDRADATDVDIRFHEGEEPERCRLEIVHTGWERLGADGPAWRDANRGGWRGLLPHYLAALAPADRAG